ncbi:MAG: sigma-70 family RNA polymerase sigma factor [Saprospiraceae bacterium]|nr:sigma-70 family RNA polymerase sigma factor [Saprospiraceae bacterium]MDP4998444.1 sigma-70 family RNA polymerase sigma factor [Saprospiraceae bacterium]
MTEKELIQGCASGNRNCQQVIFRRYAGKMLALSLRYARHQMEAEDIVQEAFIRVFDHIHTFEFRGSFEGWIKRIVINIALKNFSRKSFSQEEIGIDQDFDAPVEAPADLLMGAQEILDLVNELPDGYKIVFNLYAIEGYSHKEIAEMIGIQESTSRSQLVKARKMLQQKLARLQKIAV